MDRLAAIEIFVRVIDSGSFSAAAKSQGVKQPAVSKAIAQLEDWLGVRLLLRSTRSLSPTEAGRDFYNHAKRTVEEADEAVRAARGGVAGLCGRLRVSAPVCFARLHLVPQLPRFLAKHPDLDLHLMLDERSIDLVDEGIDVALRMGAMPDSSMVARKIGEARRLVIATPAYLQRHGTPTSPGDLQAHQVVIYTHDGVGETCTFRQGTSEMTVTPRGRVSITASEGVRAAILADMGLTIASEWSFTPELVSGAVVSVLQDWALAPVALSAVFPTGRLVSAKVREFIAFVETCLEPPNGERIA
ncbi:MAG: LysR family transcriptional regulator [Rhizomicrobium sp.]